MKSRYIASIAVGDTRPAVHVAGSNVDFAWDTARERAAQLARQNPGIAVHVNLSRWERGVWAWLDAACYLVLEALPDDSSNPIGSERMN